MFYICRREEYTDFEKLRIVHSFLTFSIFVFIMISILKIAISLTYKLNTHIDLMLTWTNTDFLFFTEN